MQTSAATLSWELVFAVCDGPDDHLPQDVGDAVISGGFDGHRVGADVAAVRS
jgi:hypothetical protein